MKLRSDPHSPGLLVNTEWEPGKPGTFSVIIGVSSYDHLENGMRARAEDTYGLGQLFVSALTAYRFFIWLRDGYRYSGSPIAKCWLLLSPGEVERRFESALVQYDTPPTMQNCRDAIGAWHKAMSELSKTAVEKSRAFFFFSGHGLEIYQEKQILLPCDYLRPPACDVNEALSTDHLKKGLASLRVPYQFFFLDACRNDQQRLRSMDIEGARLLNIRLAAYANAYRVAPLFYATTSGNQAWQPQEPSRGISLFGQALIEGLQGQPDIELDCDDGSCVVSVYPLQKFLKKRVVQLLQGYGATVSQPVVLSGIVDDVPITHVPDELVQRTDSAVPVVQLGLNDLFNQQYAVRSDVQGWQPLRRRSSFRRTHEIFGSESMSEIWLERVRVYSLSRRTWLAKTKAFTIHRVERDAGARTYRIVLSLPADEKGHWLQISDGITKFACILPSDCYDTLRYSLELDMEYKYKDNSTQWLSRVEGNLSLDNDGPLGTAAALWEQYRNLSIGDAVRMIDRHLLQETLGGKRQSPLAATVVGLILLRVDHQDLLGNWLRKLADWFPQCSDGLVLWVEQLLRQQGSNVTPSFEEPIERFLEIYQRGLPHTAEVMGYAAKQVNDLLEFGQPNAKQRIRLLQLQRSLRHALRYFRGGGLVSVFSGGSRAFGPSLALKL